MLSSSGQPDFDIVALNGEILMTAAPAIPGAGLCSAPTRGSSGHRHEQRSTIISTNLAFKQWGTTFPGAACVVALVDGFAQHCHRVEIMGDSYRDKHRLDPDRPKPTSPKSRRKRP